LLWRPDVVVTNHHVIQREDGITVTLADGSSVAATLVGRDPTTDIAVLKLDPPVTQPVFTPATGARVGQIVLALGMPGPAVTAALGVISAAGGEWRTWAGGRIDQYLRFDVAVYDGFSGGALANAAGEVIGMNSSGLSRASAMTIPVSTVVRVAEQLLKTGRVSRRYIGVGLQAVRLPSTTSQAELLAHVARESGLVTDGVRGEVHAAARGAGTRAQLPVADPREDARDHPAVELRHQTLVLEQRQEHPRRLHVALLVLEADQDLAIGPVAAFRERHDGLEEQGKHVRV
jgi:S1-C subfamily serine protease